MRQEAFTLQVDGRQVPGVLFLPDAPKGRMPLVLAQHGGSSHKLGQEILDWAEVFVARHGMALASIDGPVHGDRRAGGAAGATREATRADFFEVWQSPGSGIDAMNADWRAVIDHLSADPRIDAQAIAWVGVSMGTAYGLPLVAADARIRVAVLGMWGLSFPNSQRLGEDAPRIACPVLFQQKWDDELFTREGQIDLFGRIGTAQKWLYVYPGGHVRVEGRQMQDLEAFVLEHLPER
jgi:dienelactone hydrolase